MHLDILTPKLGSGVETDQGGSDSFAPKQYMQELARWCRRNDIVLTLDEIQAAFGRTGRLFGFEHYGIVPDLVCCGKGISSSLPVSAVIGRRDIMDQFPAGSMTSTHTGNPISSAAALASLDVIIREKLCKNAERMGRVMEKGLKRIQKKFPDRVGSVQGKGLVYALHIMKPGKRKQPDYDFAFDVVRRCVEKGLLFFSPVGACSIKISPPLVINREQVEEGCGVIEEAIEEALG